VTQLALAYDAPPATASEMPPRCERRTWDARTNPGGRNWVCSGDEPRCGGCVAQAAWQRAEDARIAAIIDEKLHHTWHVVKERDREPRTWLDDMSSRLEREYGSAKAAVDAIRAGLNGLYEDYCLEQVLPRVAVLDCTHDEAVHYWASRQWCPAERQMP
jgi:hypothetical protein